ncbi:MAG: alpha/beta hydrolase [Gammaproteobacteria bacterium]|nr:alpha/beta hydrolase [Gammaproteobacteria bacterium]
MEKIEQAPGNSSFGNLFTRIAKKKSSLINKIAPRWTNSRIDAMLFVPKAKDAKPLRLPRGFVESEINTNDGAIKVYQTGRGPTVVFVHGWGGGAPQFFPLMRGLAQCGFTALAFDHLGHGQSEQKPATLHQSIATTNEVLKYVKSRPNDGLAAIVGHSTGCIAIAAARSALVRDASLFLISPIFNYKLFFLKKLVKLQLHADLIKQYANRFAKSYRGEYEKLELARNLDKYGDVTVIAHDESDSESAISDSVRFCAKYPLTKLLVTKNCDHVRIINSESVWQELKSHLNYDDTTINFTAEIIYQ